MIPQNMTLTLDSSLSQISIDKINLNEGIVEDFRKQSYRTIGDIYELQTEGIAVVLSLPFEEAQSIWNVVLDFVSNPDKWASTIGERETLGEVHSVINLPSMLGSEINTLFSNADKLRIYSVLVRRFGLNNSDQYTLEDIGSYLELTRERVRQLQEKGLTFLRERINSPQSFEDNVIWGNDLLAEIRSIRIILETEGGPVRTEQEIFQFLSRRYETELNPNEQAHLRLLFVVFGWEHKEDLSRVSVEVRPFWIVRPEELNSNDLEDAIKKIVKTLSEKCIAVSYFDLKINVNKRLKISYGDLVLRSAIKVCSDIEQLEDDSYQLKFYRLRNLSDKAYRVLYEKGEPLSIRELHREIAQRLAMAGELVSTARALSNHMGDDSRIVAIGKRAWALSSWDDINQSTIVELMKEFFHKYGKPAKAGEIYQYVKEKRPVSRNSINTYLVDKEDFLRIAEGVYQLSSWPAPKGANSSRKQKKLWTMPRVAELVVNIFDKHSVHVMPLSELVVEVQKAMGLNRPQYATVQRCPAIEISVISETPRRLQAKLIRDYKERTDFSTLRDRLQSAVRDVLRKQPDQTMPLRTLKEEVVKRVKMTQSQTFYSYLSEMIDIQKVMIANSRMVVATLIGNDNYIDEEVSEVWDREFVYDVTISYAGPERSHAAALAEQLRSNGLTVFYDRSQLPDLIGRNLLDELREIYSENARLCVILASEAYNKSVYAQEERRAAQARRLRSPGYIVLVKLDEVKRMEGFLSTDAYLEWTQLGLDGVTNHTIEQLARQK